LNPPLMVPAFSTVAAPLATKTPNSLVPVIVAPDALKTVPPSII